MQVQPPRGWPITAEIILRTLPMARLVEIAFHFRIPLQTSPTWAVASTTLLADPAAQAVPLIYLLSRRELGAICQITSTHDEGPTQTVLARLLPLCLPSSVCPLTGP
jgi:hypothetical protein